ncbi:hypothetical protein HPP92_015459 [Vanilla planifolia]|uniref:Uncharacterized protein n=1 Tax=Vanilla planifolia TaxID=51239 RepID=A0A835QWI2_VANPL|nr:hypothetical protein HPP92_016099 [Vanilla planifolia]KAG0475773.1 hypothetical protein HPP92_015459 [Vanilla planifolia]
MKHNQSRKNGRGMGRGGASPSCHPYRAPEHRALLPALIELREGWVRSSPSFLAIVSLRRLEKLGFLGNPDERKR